MPIKIHHGPPGSYKTSGALGDDFLREAKAGRVIITNVRGLTTERVLEAFPDLPSSFEVIRVDDTSSEGRQRWAKWFHWAPRGAFFFLDEAQDIFPKSWRQANLDALDYPGGVEQAAADDRPINWDQAWAKHRHWNWDWVLTTPSIKRIRDDIRAYSEGAFKHKNLALIGWSGRYVEGFHMADDDGGAASQMMSINQKKVPGYVWKIYDSTATGVHRDTKAGLSLFKNPRILILLGILAIAAITIFRNGGDIVPVGKDQAAAGQPVAPGGAIPGPTPAPVLSPSAGGNGTGYRGSGPVVVGPFGPGPVEIVGRVVFRDQTRYSFRHAGQLVEQRDYAGAGYTLRVISECLVEIQHGAVLEFAKCARPAFQPGPVGGPLLMASAPQAARPNEPSLSLIGEPPPSASAKK